MATVYRIRHRGWDVDLAVKFPKPELIPSEGWMQTFERECTTWINLPPHDNVVQCHYVRRLGGVPRVFMEFVPSTNLNRLIRDQTFYSEDRADNFERMLDVLIQFAWGIQHAHNHGVIHQDVKPPNLLVMKDCAAKVTDFGLAQLLPNAEFAAEETGAKYPRGGTPIYRAPEQEQHIEASTQTDMWGFGLSVLELFAGGIFWNHGLEAPDALRRFRKDGAYYDFLPPMSAELAALLQKCFQEDRTLRPQSMDEIATVLVDLYRQGTGKTYPRQRPESTAHSLDAINNRAVSFLDLGKSAKSERLWKQLLDENPGFFPAIFNRDLFLWRSGRITDAQIVERTREQADAVPTEIRRQYLLARIYLERGDVSAAMEILKPLYHEGNSGRDVAFAFAMAQSLERRECRRLHSAPVGQKPLAVAVTLDARDVFLGLESGQLGRVTLEPEVAAGIVGKHPAAITALDLSEQQTRVLAGAADGSIAYWDFQRKTHIFAREGKYGRINDAAVSASGRHGAVVDQTGKLRVLDLRNGHTIRSIQAHDGETTAVVFSRCGAYLFTGGNDQRVKLWDAWSGDEIVSIKTEGERVQGVMLNPGRTVAVAASGASIESWDLKNQSRISCFTAHQDDICSFAVTPDLRYALTATTTRTTKLWNLASGQCLRSLRLGAPAALNRDGDIAIGIGKNGVLETWAVHLDSPPFGAPYHVCQHVPVTASDDADD